MSDPISASDPSAIVEQLQTLTDNEGDLADTAFAVIEQQQEQEQQHVIQTQHEAESSSENQIQSQAQIQEQSEDAQELDKATDINEAENVLLDNAESMENVLEESIPDAPIQSSIPISDPINIDPSLTSTSIATLDDSSHIAAIAVQPDGIAAEANQLLNAVEADLNNPVLPESMISPAHDVITETANEEDTSKIIVDIEEPTAENVAEAAMNPENDTNNIISQHGNDIEGTLAPLPTPAIVDPTVKTEIPAPVAAVRSLAQVPPTDLKPIQSDIPLPEGLSVSSPSVVNNRDLIQAWQSDSKNPTLLLSLFNWAMQKTEIADARAWYTALAVDNPTAVEPLLALINLELALSNFPHVEGLFAKALKGPSGGVTAAADVSIWKAYLHYIRRQNPIIESSPNAETVRGTITKAYEFALKECGFDRESGEIWEEYIKFSSESPAKNQWEIQAQQDTLRKLYQRAVCIPLNNLEALWKSYDSFESSVNKATSKKFLAERSPAYMTARTALRELRALTDPLPKPILPPIPTFNELDRAAVAGWKSYLKWEESNPLVIEDESILSARIGYALRKCLSEMRHFPELWHYAAIYYSQQNKKEEATEILKAGVQACPKSFLLTFALAELLEEQSQIPATHELFQNFLASLSPEIDELRKVIEREVANAKGPEIPPPAGLGNDITMDGDGISEYQRMVEERENRGKLVEERRGKEVEELMKGVNVGWIMYMRFARRVEGIKGARAIFGKARKSAYLTWHIFEASAMMEYHGNKDHGVAIRIFELGLKLFSEEVEYVIKYLQFLLSVNDDTNARALFERSALKIPPSSSRPLWDTWARYEYLYGDLSAVHKLESRFIEVFPNDSPLKRFAQRYTYNGIDQIAIRDLGFSSSIRSSIQPNHIQQSLPVPSASTSAQGQAQGQIGIGNPPPVLAPTGIASPGGGYKRSAPESPQRENRRGSIDRSPKRYRGTHSPPPPPRRYPDREREVAPHPPHRERERDRNTSGRFNQPSSSLPPNGRDRSPFTNTNNPTQPPIPQRGSVPPPGYGTPIVPPPSSTLGIPPAALDRDRSGLGKPLIWFIGNLPTARAFDGPIFRPDDIVGLFSNIAPSGLGIPASGPGPGGPPIPPQPPMPVRGGYPDADRRYGALPPRNGRY
ncbi:uncharacterized protein IL334_004092 [Kwoniella shivajii]|uniref:mRNA 3'-end-processing protein RNA14 n=1 Tax=Kwoniella shivajii TaxID=564305 RepID=A0ABZ1CZS5_9TREE|nr:hypothetical protein IL334_004092 [Kwoniella shivajii]